MAGPISTCDHQSSCIGVHFTNYPLCLPRLPLQLEAQGGNVPQISNVSSHIARYRPHPEADVGGGPRCCRLQKRQLKPRKSPSSRIFNVSSTRVGWSSLNQAVRSFLKRGYAQGGCSATHRPRHHRIDDASTWYRVTPRRRKLL